MVSDTSQRVSNESRPADVLVVFGITGNLAKVMTFRSLYRLELRKLLDCPIVGVAVEDWTIDKLKEYARDSIEGTGERSEEHTSELQSLTNLVCRLLLEKKKEQKTTEI